MVNSANSAPRIAVEILFLGGGLCEGRKKIVAESRKCAPKKTVISYSTQSNWRPKHSYYFSV